MLYTTDTSSDTNTVADLSGQGNTGQLVSMSTSTSPVAGKIGGALKFNGTSQYVSIPNSASLTQTAAITVSAWVKSSGTNVAYSVIVNKRLSPFAPYNNWTLDTSSTGNASEFCITNAAGGGPTSGQWCLSSGTLSSNWTHVVGTYDGSTQRLYLNGSLVASQSVSITLVTSGNPVLIGYSSAGAQYFSGSIDDVRVYNRALSAQEVAQLYALGQANVAHSNTVTLTTGLVGYWTFDGPSLNWKTNTVADLSGQGNTGQLVSMSTSTSPVARKIGGALKFNGSSSQVNCGTGASLQPTSVTLSAWIKPNANWSGYQFITGMTQSANWGGGYHFVSQNGTPFRFAINGYTTNFVAFGSQSDTPVGVWTHVVGTYDGSVITLYKNGVLYGTLPYSTPVTYTSTNCYMGFGGGANTYFNGTIDDARIYNRALSYQEIQQLYALGQANVAHSNTVTLTTGLVGYWTFDGPSLNWKTNTVADLSGQNNTGTLNFMSTSTSPVAGKIGGALKFDGSTQYVSEGTSISNIHSVAFWVKATTGVAQGLITLTGANIAFIITNGNSQIAAVGFTSTIYVDGIASSSPGLYDTNWHHIVMTGTGAITGNQIEIGRGPGARGSHTYLKGILDDVRFYNRALSAQEVQQLYLMGK